MVRWLNAHAEIKEEFYTAIDEQNDDIVAALTIFRELVERFPDKIEVYANLAIATAVTWDQPQRGVYDYVGHQVRTKSELPPGQMGAIENFACYASADRPVRQYVTLLPWEFLVHVVNHKTPASERQWAVRNYQANRVMYGKCYQEVPYDKEMLDSGSEVAKLNGKPYTLENIRQFGGVCAMQADFAARVGKSMGVPAEYVGGESSYKDLHAWVMWVEVQNVTKSGIAFSLQSHGRYSYDKYYVGTLTDPHTGQQITDRQLELRLHAVGMNPTARRQVALAMRAYPMLREKGKMAVADQLRFLYDAINVSPWNEEPWLVLAKMSRDGAIGKKHGDQMLVTLKKLFSTFAALPDFSWKVFDDLITFQQNPRQRAKLYGLLVAQYEKAGRPDLSCEARLKYTAYLVADERYKEAVQGLGFTIKKFPDEGRYVPKMLDKLEDICGKHPFPHVKELLAEFYQDLLPKIPATRGQSPSTFCKEMYKRAIERFKSLGRDDLATQYGVLLARLEAGPPQGATVGIGGR